MPNKRPSPPPADDDGDDAIDVEEVRRPSPSPAERVRMSKLRGRARAGLPLDPLEAAELHDYEEARADTARGASQSRTIKYEESEHAAMGTGDAAVSAAAHGAMVREEGRRLDSLVFVGISALRESNNVYKDMVATLLKRTENFERSQVDLLNAFRNSALAQIDAEVEATRIAAEAEQGAKKDPLAEMAEQLLPIILAKMGGGK